MLKRTLVVVPMKDPRQAKSRLGGVLNKDERAALARRLFRLTLTVLSDLRQSISFDLAVVTASAEVSVLARTHGAHVHQDPCQGLNAALALSASRAAAAGYERLGIFPADLAAPDPADLALLLTHPSPGSSVVICPATDGGTNALLVSPPLGLPFCFGPGSAQAHARVAVEHGLTPICLPLDSLSLDVDTASDLSLATRRTAELEVLA